MNSRDTIQGEKDGGILKGEENVENQIDWKPNSKYVMWSVGIW